MIASRDFDDVLIIGCGPVGATLANLLGQQGHSVAVAEMHAEIYDKPRAINLDQEALRTLQAIGSSAPYLLDWITSFDAEFSPHGKPAGCVD